MHFNIYNKKNSEGHLSVITTTRYAFTVHTYIYQKNLIESFRSMFINSQKVNSELPL